MAQTFQALRCFQCSTFQVQIKKKSKRWECKLCGVKQSLTKIYGEGSSKDCRVHVQKLNELRRIQDDLKVDSGCSYQASDEWSEEGEFEEETSQETVKKSKWDHYLGDKSVQGSECEKDDQIKMNFVPHESPIQDKNISGWNYPTTSTISNNAEKPLTTPTSDELQATVKRSRSSEYEDLTPKIYLRKENQYSQTAKIQKNKCSKTNKKASKRVFCATKNDELDEILEL